MTKEQPPPISQACPPASAQSGALITAAILCFLGTSVPLVWLVVRAANLRHKQLLSALTEPRLPPGFLFLEEVVCAAGMGGLLIASGVLLCARARWAMHVTGGVIGLALVGATGATVAEGIRGFSHEAPTAKQASDAGIEIMIRVLAGVVWPLMIALPLVLESARAAIVSRRGSMPATSVGVFAAGVVLVWYGLAATSLHEQSVPVGIYFGHLFSGTDVTLWRVGFAAAWILAGILLFRSSRVGWFLAVAVTLAALRSEAMLAAARGPDAIVDKLHGLDRLTARLALARGPDAPWLAALSRSASTICLFALLMLAGWHLFFEGKREDELQGEDVEWDSIDKS